MPIKIIDSYLNIEGYRKATNYQLFLVSTTTLDNFVPTHAICLIFMFDCI